jgi:hypothetical protein
VYRAIIKKFVNGVLPLSMVLGFVSGGSALASRGHEFNGGFGWGVSDGETQLQGCTSEADCRPCLSGKGLGQFDERRGIVVKEEVVRCS